MRSFLTPAVLFSLAATPFANAVGSCPPGSTSVLTVTQTVTEPASTVTVTKNVPSGAPNKEPSSGPSTVTVTQTETQTVYTNPPAGKTSPGGIRTSHVSQSQGPSTVIVTQTITLPTSSHSAPPFVNTTAVFTSSVLSTSSPPFSVGNATTSGPLTGTAVPTTSSSLQYPAGNMTSTILPSGTGVSTFSTVTTSSSTTSSSVTSSSTITSSATTSSSTTSSSATSSTSTSSSASATPTLFYISATGYDYGGPNFYSASTPADGDGAVEFRVPGSTSEEYYDGTSFYIDSDTGYVYSTDGLQLVAMIYAGEATSETNAEPAFDAGTLDPAPLYLGESGTDDNGDISVPVICSIDNPDEDDSALTCYVEGNEEYDVPQFYTNEDGGYTLFIGATIEYNELSLVANTTMTTEY